MASSMKKSLIIVWLFYIVFAVGMDGNSSRTDDMEDNYDTDDMEGNKLTMKEYSKKLLACKINVRKNFKDNETIANFMIAYLRFTEADFKRGTWLYGYYLDLHNFALLKGNFDSWTPNEFCMKKQFLVYRDCQGAMIRSKFQNLFTRGSDAFEVFYLEFSEDDFNVKTEYEELNKKRLEKIFPNWKNSVPENLRENIDYVRSVEETFIIQVYFVKAYMLSFKIKFDEFSNDTFSNPNDYCERKMQQNTPLP